MLFRQSRQRLSWVTQEWPTTSRMGWSLKPTCPFVSTCLPTGKMVLRPFWCPSHWTMRPHHFSLFRSGRKMWLQCLLQLSQEFMWILQVHVLLDIINWLNIVVVVWLRTFTFGTFGWLRTFTDNWLNRFYHYISRLYGNSWIVCLDLI